MGRGLGHMWRGGHFMNSRPYVIVYMYSVEKGQYIHALCLT